MIQILTLLIVIATLGFLLIQNGGLSAIPGRGSRRRIILDSCALIDGRIVELVKTGFVTDTLVVPKFILRELQTLADGNDSHKRERARFGLEVVVQLQEVTPLKIEETNYTTVRAIDDKLILLAKELKAALCTTDFNLNKVATVEGVQVLNVNELSHALRPVILPGENQTIKIVQKGNNKNQGVGYQEDGTMVVVENGAKYIGKTVAVTVEHMLQTVAGKMVFAKLQNVAHETTPIHAASAQPVATVRQQAPQMPRHQSIHTSQKAATRESKTRIGKRPSHASLEQTLLQRVNESPTPHTRLRTTNIRKRPLQ